LSGPSGSGSVSDGSIVRNGSCFYRRRHKRTRRCGYDYIRRRHMPDFNRTNRTYNRI